jgi:hypothetical protein
MTSGWIFGSVTVVFTPFFGLAKNGGRFAAGIGGRDHDLRQIV